jgi:hypothetical protein
MYYQPIFAVLWIVPLVVGGLAAVRSFGGDQESPVLAYLLGLSLIGLLCSGGWIYEVFSQLEGAGVPWYRVKWALWQALLPVTISFLFQAIIVVRFWLIPREV